MAILTSPLPRLTWVLISQAMDQQKHVKTNFKLYQVALLWEIFSGNSFATSKSSFKSLIEEMTIFLCVFLGLSNRSTPDNFFTASSSIDVYYRPGEGRLNNSHVVGRGSGAWCSASHDKTPYLQIYLGSVRKVTAISTQGHPLLHKWVTLFRLSYSLNGVTWTKTKKVQVNYFLISVNANTVEAL